MFSVVIVTVLFPRIVSCLDLSTATAQITISPDILSDFNSFKENFRKVYTPEEEIIALQNFAARSTKVKEHNSKFERSLASFTQGLNEYSDISEHTLNELVNGFQVLLLHEKSLPDSVLNNITIPSSLNYTALRYTTSVRNQGTCGCCWAFSTTGVFEGQFFKNKSNLTKVSEQNLVDCNKNYEFGNYGCNGGNMLLAYEYIKNNGISMQSMYPYRGADTFPCIHNPSNSVGRVTSYNLLPPGNETLILLHLIAVGPLSIAIDASHASFLNYQSGIYDEPACTNILNHAMLLTGFGTDTTYHPHINYWIVKNSYGITWGERGYFRIKRGVNMCGIADYANYAFVV